MNFSKKVFNLLLLLHRAFGGYKWYIALMAVLSVLSGALEGIGITAIIPLLSFIGAGEKATDSISLAIAKFFEYFHLPYTAKFLLLFIVILFLAKAVFLFLSQQVTSRIMADFERKVRSELLKLTFAARWPFLSFQKVGHLDQMLTTEVGGSSSVLYYLSSAMLVAANLIIYSILVLNISFVIALAAFFSGLIIFFVFLPVLRKVKIVSTALVQENKKLAHYANEHLIGAKSIKSMNLEKPVLERGVAFLDVMRGLYLTSSFLRNVTAALLQFSGVFFVVLLFAFLYKTSAFHFASFAVVVYALNKVITNVQYAQNHAHVISSQVPYLASIVRYQDEAMSNQERDTGTASFRFEKDVAFKNVDFAYRSGEPALSRITFSVARGEIVGLIGPSGAGKTTIVDLLLRLISPKSGVVEVDGKNISEINLKEWRHNVGYVPQDVFLLNDTIENNIRFYDDSVSDRDMISAAKAAHLYDFVRNQPDGFRTQVGERGVSLSGGQRQRIALARVLARKPTLLILDEATNALDSESEALIQKSVESLKGDTTVIIIAHRVSTVRASDKLIVLDKGKIVETGPPEELLKNKDSYFFKVYHLRT